MLKKKKKKTEQEQLPMGLRFSRFQLFLKLKRAVRSIEKKFSVIPFWRNGLIWACIITIISISILSTLLISKSYSQLPPEIPIIYDTFEEEWQSYPKVYIFAIPFALVVLGLINIQLLQKTYYMNKRLILMICVMLIAVYFLGLIATNQILLLSTN